MTFDADTLAAIKKREARLAAEAHGKSVEALVYKKGCKDCREKALAARAKLEEQEDMSPS